MTRFGRWTLGLALIAAMVPATALAADLRVALENEAVLTLVDGSLKTDSDGFREADFHLVFAQPRGEPDLIQVISGPLLLDCIAGKYRLGRTTNARADLTPVGGGEARLDWRNLVADSPFDRVAAYACRGARLPAADGGELKAAIAGYLARRTPETPPVSPPID